MRLKGHYLLLLIVSVGFSFNSLAQEFPFIHYTPKDGLINSRIRNVYQDSRGRLFFMTANGLSMYDGARFNNYTSEDGLLNPVVNDMLEINQDSILVATNTNGLNAWSRGRIKTINTTDFCPVINKFLRTRDGMIMVATDQGVYSLDGNRFYKIDIENKVENDLVISYDDIQEIGEYLLVKVNFGMTNSHGIFLLDKNTKKLTPFLQEAFSSLVQLPEYDVLICASPSLVRCYSLSAAANGLVKPKPLPAIYKPLENLHATGLVLDQNGNLWCIRLNSIYKIGKDGSLLVLNKTTGLDLNNINGVFLDKENVIWIQTDGSGLIKLANNNVEIATALFSKSATGISAIYSEQNCDTTWLFNTEDSSIYASSSFGTSRYTLTPPIKAAHLLREGNHFYLFNDGKVYMAKPTPGRKNSFTTSMIYQFDLFSRINLNRAILYDGYLISPGPELVVLRNSEKVFTEKLPSYSDYVVLDRNNSLWVAPRNGGLLRFSLRSYQPNQFLKFEHNYQSVVPSLNSRSIVIDTSNKVWVGTRYEGLYCFEFKDTTLVNQWHFTTHDGLTDNFIYYLSCDQSNNIWVGSQSGVDKISMENGRYIVEGVTRNNNIFQIIQVISVAKNNRVWTLGNSGSILRITNNPKESDYQPQLQICRIKTGDTIFNMPPAALKLDHQQNTITFELAATSFIDEKQIRYSYLLEGSDNTQWSTPSTQATLNFINLPHGKYLLRIRSYFPVSSYAPKEITYAFIITPPWWDTWWSKLLIAAALVAMIVLVIRFYYQRKLQKQKILFEKQQAVEQERTRIAMEMHDDLGSGLTTIRYLAGGLSLQSGNSSKEKAEKIASSAKSLVDNMNDIIWTMKSDNNSLNEALAYIRKQAAEQLETAGIDYHIDFPKNLPTIKLSNELKRNLLLISKEAVHNIVKHAGATNVSLSAEWEAGKLRLWIADNGKGIDLPNLSTFGNGIKSMKKRAEEIKALLEVMNSEGTTIIITAPV